MHKHLRIGSTQYPIANVHFSNFYNVHFCLKLTTFKRALALLHIGTIAWIVWDLTSQIYHRDRIGLFVLIILFEFIVAGDLDFLSHIYIKVFMAPIITAEKLVFPQYAYKEDSRCAVYLYNM